MRLMGPVSVIVTLGNGLFFASASLPEIATPFVALHVVLLFSNTETAFEPLSGIARSSLPSPSKSPTPRPAGAGPDTKLVGARKVPVPVPSKTDTAFELKLLTTKSSLPSLLKSPTANPTPGLAPVGKLVAALKVPVPDPK